MEDATLNAAVKTMTAWSLDVEPRIQALGERARREDGEFAGTIVLMLLIALAAAAVGPLVQSWATGEVGKLPTN